LRRLSFRGREIKLLNTTRGCLWRVKVKQKNRKSLTLRETWVQKIKSRTKSVTKLKISLKSSSSSIR